MASKKFTVDIDLNKNQLLNAVLQNLAVAPTSPLSGQTYWDTVDNTGYIWTGTEWGDILSVGPVSLSGLTDTSITSVGSGEIIVWNGSAWINNTLAEAGIPTDLSGLTDTDLTGVADGYVMVWNDSTGKWEAVPFAGGNDYVSGATFNTSNGILTLSRISGGTVTVDLDDRYALTGHTHAYSASTDVNIVSVTSGEITTWDGTKWINQTLAEAGISTSAHTHTLDSLSNVTITANSNGEILMWNGSAWINQTLQEMNIAAADAFAAHTGDTSIHFIINDLTTTATTEVWSAAQIQSELDTINSLISGALVYKGGYNANTNTPDLDTSPSSAITIGWTYTVTFSGDFFTEAVQVGDMLIAEIDSPTTLADWTIVNKNIPDIVPASETEPGIIEIATSGETNTGTDDTRAITPLKLNLALATYKYSETIGNGALTTFTITHNLGTLDVLIQVKEISTGAIIICDDKATGINTVSLTFNTAPTSSQYRVTILK